MSSWDEIEYPDERRNGLERAVWWTEKMGATVFPVAVMKKKVGKRLVWTKQPFMGGWQNKENCARTGEEAIKMWNSKPGWIRADCGILLDDFVLLDLDSKEGKYDGREEFKELIDKRGLNLCKILEGALVYTTPGRSGGVHCLWGRPKDDGSALGGNWAGFSKTVPAAGVEVLGNGHFVLAPCSKRPDKVERGEGWEYEMKMCPGGRDGLNVGIALAEVPVELWEILLKNGNRAVESGMNGGRKNWGGKLTLEGALLASDGEKVLPGSRHDVLFVEAARRALAGNPVIADVVCWLEEILRSGVIDDGEEILDDGEEIGRMAGNAMKWAKDQLTDEGREFFKIDFDVKEIIRSVGLIKHQQKIHRQIVDRSLQRWNRISG